jgi:DNA-binding GntR family transcriptional regulator
MRATQQILTTGLADEIAFRLAEGILEGEYRPGDRIMPNDVCLRFGVSRTPVREALRKLQAQKLIVFTPNKGATVRIPTSDELREGWAIRAELEGFATELACSGTSEETLEELNRAQSSIESAWQALATEDGLREDDELKLHKKIRLGNEDFHATILRAAHNDQLRTICESLQSYLPKDYAWRATLHSNAIHALFVDEHRAIYDAIAQGSKSAARKAMSAHIVHARDLLILYLTEHGFWE